MSLIYQAKEFVSLPRIEVRIVDKMPGCKCAGYAYPGKNIVHIRSDYANNHPGLTHVVLHEILHAVLGTDHNDSCFLMNPVLPREFDNDAAWKSFKKYF